MPSYRKPSSPAPQGPSPKPEGTGNKNMVISSASTCCRSTGQGQLRHKGPTKASHPRDLSLKPRHTASPLAVSPPEHDIIVSDPRNHLLLLPPPCLMPLTHLAPSGNSQDSFPALPPSSSELSHTLLEDCQLPVTVSYTKQLIGRHCL